MPDPGGLRPQLGVVLAGGRGTRMGAPDKPLLPIGGMLPVWYYRILTAHGLNMLIFFIIFFEMAILYFAGPILLGARQPAPKTGWLGFWLMLAGALLVNFTVFWGRADVLFSSYVPLRAHPLYYLGIILFAVGALIATLLFFAALVVGADYVADYLMSDINFPVGVVTGALGAPFLLWLLASGRTGRRAA